MEDAPTDELQDDLSLNDDLSNDFSIDPFMDPIGGSPIDKHKDLLRGLTDFDPIIKKKIRNWLGLEWDDDLKDYKEVSPAIINEKGARWAIGFLQTYQSKTNFITNINQREFTNIQEEILDSVWMVFPTNEYFDVKSNQDWHRLCTELQHSAFLVLAGAGDGKYTKFLGESVQRTESINLTSPPHSPGLQQGGILSGIRNKLLGR